jgi:hypothetical protein
MPQVRGPNDTSPNKMNLSSSRINGPPESPGIEIKINITQLVF